jgi:hypothetical protein
VIRLSLAVSLLVVSGALPSPTAGLEFPQAESAAALRQALGEVYDITEFDPEPHWGLSGRWVFTCGEMGCARAALSDIGFDLALTMVRPNGSFSHTHTFSDFSATALRVDDDNLYVDGTIVGTGGVGGLTAVSLAFIGVSGAGELRLEFPGNDHIMGQLGGVTVQSR